MNYYLSPPFQKICTNIDREPESLISILLSQWPGSSGQRGERDGTGGGDHVRLRSAPLLQRCRLQPDRLQHRLLVGSDPTKPSMNLCLSFLPFCPEAFMH